MKKLISLLLVLLFALTMTGCGGDEPTEPPTEPEFMSEDNLADTRWVAVREVINSSDGTTIENDLYGFGYELFLFEDGTAQWLRIDAADRRPLSNPYGFWKLSGEKLIFSETEDFPADEEYGTESFREKDGTLIWEQNEYVEVWLEPAEMEQWLTPLTPEDLIGDWQLEFMTADGCDYDAEDLHFDSYLSIGTGNDGEPVVDSYYSTEFNETQLYDQALPILWDETPEASGWAPWVAELSTGKDVERSLIYLGSQELLYVEDLYYMDGAPAVALYRYRRV